MEENKILPRSSWKDLSITQLQDVKLQISDTYYNLRNINASFSNQYLGFLSELDELILRREQERQQG